MGGIPGDPADTVENRHAVHAGHYEVEQDQADEAVVRAFQELQRLLAGTTGLGLEAEPFDRFFEDAALGRIVIDDQNTLGHLHATLLLTRITTVIPERLGPDFAPASDTR